MSDFYKAGRIAGLIDALEIVHQEPDPSVAPSPWRRLAAALFPANSARAAARATRASIAARLRARIDEVDSARP